MKKSNQIWNLPNILTMLRVVSVPFFIYLLVQPDSNSRWFAFALFAVASITDLVDGYLARKFRQETELGKFLDPLADKALVLGAFMTFLLMSSQIQIWMVFCIIGRDFLITAMRYLAVKQGASLRTSVFGKVKTVFQMFAICTILISFLFISYKERDVINQMYDQVATTGTGTWELALQNLFDFIKGSSKKSIAFQLASFGPYYLMLFTTCITIVSGMRYLYSNYQLLLPPFVVARRKAKNTRKKMHTAGFDSTKKSST